MPPQKTIGDIEMVWCRPGTFQFGLPQDGICTFVTLTKGFWIGKYPVTQAQWHKVIGSNPSHFKGFDHPVDRVSWDDCRDFIRRMNDFGGRFRLPTEAEWEYACRAGTDGRVKLDEVAWYKMNSGNTTHPVGQKKPNAWGIYDMHGNVDEWCSDWYDELEVPDGCFPEWIDWNGPLSGSSRVLRGGCWRFDAEFCLTWTRDCGNRIATTDIIGFRLVSD